MRWAMKQYVLLHFRSLTGCCKTTYDELTLTGYVQGRQLLTHFIMLENIFCCLLHHEGQGTIKINSLNWKTEILFLFFIFFLSSQAESYVNQLELSPVYMQL